MWESRELRPSTGHTIRWVCCLKFLWKEDVRSSGEREMRLEPLSFLCRTNRMLWNEQEVPHDPSRKLFFTQRHVFCTQSARPSFCSPRLSCPFTTCVSSIHTPFPCKPVFLTHRVRRRRIRKRPFSPATIVVSQD